LASGGHEPQSVEQLEQVSPLLQRPSPQKGVQVPQSVGHVEQVSPLLHRPSPQNPLGPSVRASLCASGGGRWPSPCGPSVTPPSSSGAGTQVTPPSGSSEGTATLPSPQLLWPLQPA